MDVNEERNLIMNEIQDWLERHTGQKQTAWDRIPDIGLYMDQVVTFLERQLYAYQRNSDDKIVTPSMINNYTKDRVIPRAESKKYSREHIALLTVICSLKKVLSMPDLADLLKDFTVDDSETIERFYARFCQVQEQAVARTSEIVKKRVEEAEGENGKEILRNLALQLAAEAQTRCIAAEQILNILDRTEKAGKLEKAEKKGKSDKPEIKEDAETPEEKAAAPEDSPAGEEKVPTEAASRQRNEAQSPVPPKKADKAPKGK